MKLLNKDNIITTLIMAFVVLAFGIVGEMDYQDACRADPVCKVK
jgi:hypothetical protein